MSEPRTLLSQAVLALALLVVAGAAGFLSYRLFAPHGSTLTAISSSGTPGGPGPGTLPGGSETDAAHGTGAGNGSGSTRDTGSTEGTGPAGSTGPQAIAPAPTAIPDRLPPLSLPDATGLRRTLSEWKGRPLLLNFWATWCAPCRREIPLLKSLQHEHAADALQVVGIAVDFRDAVTKYAHDIGIDYPVLIGEQDGLDAVKAFGMETVFPFSVFADAQGRIVTLKVGELHRDEAEMILEHVRTLDQGRIELATAREEISAGIRRLALERAAGAAESPAPR